MRSLVLANDSMLLVYSFLSCSSTTTWKPPFRSGFAADCHLPLYCYFLCLGTVGVYLASVARQHTHPPRHMLNEPENVLEKFRGWVSCFRVKTSGLMHNRLRAGS